MRIALPLFVAASLVVVGFGCSGTSNTGGTYGGSSSSGGSSSGHSSSSSGGNGSSSSSGSSSGQSSSSSGSGGSSGGSSSSGSGGSSSGGMDSGFACMSPADCGGQVCCGEIPLLGGMAPNCDSGQITTSCKAAASCPTMVGLSCSGMQQVQLCKANGDCTDPNNNSCCTFSGPEASSLSFCFSAFEAMLGGGHCM